MSEQHDITNIWATFTEQEVRQTGKGVIIVASEGVMVGVKYWKL